MANKSVKVEAATAASLPENGEEEHKMVIKFSKPFMFEGTEYTEIDLSGLDELTASDMIAVDKYLKDRSGVEIMQEVTIEYACILAAKATKLPVEFFYALPAKYAVRVKNKVVGFLLGSE